VLRSSPEVSYKGLATKVLLKSLCRDLLSKSCEGTSFRELVQRSFQEDSFRDLAKRALTKSLCRATLNRFCQETSYMSSYTNLAQMSFIEGVRRDLLNLSCQGTTLGVLIQRAKRYLMEIFYKDLA
jgi:hypothetical protein